MNDEQARLHRAWAEALRGVRLADCRYRVAIDQAGRGNAVWSQKELDRLAEDMAEAEIRLDLAKELYREFSDVENARRQAEGRFIAEKEHYSSLKKNGGQ